MILKLIGNSIKQSREKKGISQVKLSESTGVVREQISRIENGQINPTIETVSKLSEALDMTLSELFDFSKLENTEIEESKLKPFVKWAGGKSQLMNEIMNRIPKEFNRYFEPFVGGGAVFMNMKPSKAVIADYNQELVYAYESFKNKNYYDLMVTEILFHEKNHSEEYYYSVREMDRKDNYQDLAPYLKAARLIYLNKACFNGIYRVNSKGYFNVPWNKKEKVNAYNKKLFESIRDYLSSDDIVIVQGDFQKVVEKALKDDFVYFDPPYDTFDEQENFTAYTKNDFGKDEQLRLANVFKELDKRGVKVMLSNHNTKYINEIYQGFRIEVVEARRIINSKASGRGKVEEVIITNY